MDYPIEKYRFFKNGNRIIAVSTYAGKTVRGVAVCHPNDTYDENIGKQIAAARCAINVANKRYKRAQQKVLEADKAVQEAIMHKQKMKDYVLDASSARYTAYKNLTALIDKI